MGEVVEVASKTIWLPVHEDGEVDWGRLDGGDEIVVGDDKPMQKLVPGWSWQLFVIRKIESPI
jgi:hypothetical protein